MRQLMLIPALYASWLAMMAFHEAGHVLHAKLSGGEVRRVVFPLFGFSETVLNRNPHPLFVAWGGVIWGSLIPLLAWSATPCRWPTVRHSLQFFAGFCLIANGAYIGVGWIRKAGDAGDLIDYGVPVWLMCVLGATAVSLGLVLWHFLDRRVRGDAPSDRFRE